MKRIRAVRSEWTPHSNFSEKYMKKGKLRDFEGVKKEKMIFLIIKKYVLFIIVKTLS